jgi:hypothetical protein
MNSTTDHTPRESKSDRNICAVCGQPVMRSLQGVESRNKVFTLGHVTAEAVAASKARAERLMAALGR